MSQSAQHEKHLNADGFSAFVDNAMSEDERLEVILHIADCEQCREIIVLLQEAGSGPETVAAPAPSRTSWFSIHPLLGASMAGLAAVLITSAAFLTQRHYAHRDGTITQTIVAGVSTGNAPPPVPLPIPFDASKIVPRPAKISAGPPVPPKPSTSFEAQTAAAADALHLNAGEEKTDVFNTEADDDASQGSQQWRARPLPSNLPAIAVVTRVHNKLAADTNGDLFLSYDGGGHWRHISKQWRGNIVRLGTSSGPADGQHVAESAIPDATGRAPIPSAGKARFELTTDTGGIWISNDGTHWHAL